MSLDFTLYYENDGHKTMVFDANVTHNLGEMAEEAGIYKSLWRPDENEFKQAKDVIEALKNGVEKMEKDPLYFKKFNPKNGWGDYDHFLKFTKMVLKACETYPNAFIDISR